MFRANCMSSGETICQSAEGHPLCRLSSTYDSTGDCKHWDDVVPTNKAPSFQLSESTFRSTVFPGSTGKKIVFETRMMHTLHVDPPPNPLQVLGFADDADGVLPLRSISGRRSQSRNSLISPPGAGLALMYEQLSVQCFEREVSTPRVSRRFCSYAGRS